MININVTTRTTEIRKYTDRPTQQAEPPRNLKLQNKPILKTLVSSLKKWIYNKNYPERNTRKQTHFEPIKTRFHALTGKI